MNRYRVETVRGRHLLCGGLIAEGLVKPGQTWAAADGSDHTVRVSAVRGDWMGYTWKEHDKPVYHEKINFAFQCRYCLVLDTPEIPEWVTA